MTVAAAGAGADGITSEQKTPRVLRSNCKRSGRMAAQCRRRACPTTKWFLVSRFVGGGDADGNGARDSTWGESWWTGISCWWERGNDRSRRRRYHRRAGNTTRPAVELQKEGANGGPRWACPTTKWFLVIRFVVVHRATVLHIFPWNHFGSALPWPTVLRQQRHTPCPRKKAVARGICGLNHGHDGKRRFNRLGSLIFHNRQAAPANRWKSAQKVLKSRIP